MAAPFLLNCPSVYSSELLYDSWFTANLFFLATSPLRPTTRDFYKLNTYGLIPYGTSSLTRGWVYRLLLFLVLASTVIFGSESRGTHDHILLFQFRDSSPTWRAKSPHIYAPETGWPSFSYPRYWAPFSSLLATHRATVEVFESASTLAAQLTTTTTTITTTSGLRGLEVAFPRVQTRRRSSNF
jgi:hypothetical protein